jgi:O-antigen/teichoic acid export membrane protein
MLLRHSMIYLVARVGPSLLSLLGIAIYTRMLSPEDYGLYALVVGGAGLAQVWFFEWLRMSTLRFLAQSGEDRRDELASSLAAGFLLASAAAIVAALLALALLRDAVPDGVLEAGILLLCVQGLFGTMAATTWADLAPRRFAVMTFSSAVLSLSLGVLGLWLGFGPLVLVVALAIGQTAAALQPLSREWHRLRRDAVRWPLLRRCLRYGAPLSLATGFGLVVMSSDRFMIAWLLDTGATGGFVAAYELARNPISALLSVISQAAVPLAIHHLERGGTAAARDQLRRNLALLLAVGLPSTLGLALVAGDLAAVMLGAGFRSAAASLIPWIALAALLHGITVFHFNVAFQLAQNTMPMAWISLMAAALNLGLNYWWIPLFGVIGAAWASVASYVFALTCSALWGRRVFALPRPDGDVLKILVASGLMAVAVWAMPVPAGVWALGVRIATGMVSYGALLWVLNVGEIRSVLRARLDSLSRGGARRAPAMDARLEGAGSGEAERS